MIGKTKKIEYSKISIHDELYPSQLREIAQPPEVFYIRGHLPQDKPTIAVVGTRRCTAYGRRATEHIVKGLIRAGVVIVSGMAEGIDTEAHKAALEAGGETVAVLGSGIDESVIYPKSNTGLAREIEKHGAVTSEFDPYAHSEAFYFPQRNRIISGLSLGVVVIEAREKSGALITANFALDQNREVFAVPGGIFWETSKGTNNLIQQGAKCVTRAEDILEELNLPIPSNEERRIVGRNPIEQKIIEALVSAEGSPLHVNALIEKTNLSASDVSSALTLMELEDIIKNVGGDYYVLGT